MKLQQIDFLLDSGVESSYEQNAMSIALSSNGGQRVTQLLTEKAKSLKVQTKDTVEGPEVNTCMRCCFGGIDASCTYEYGQIELGTERHEYHPFGGRSPGGRKRGSNYTVGNTVEGSYVNIFSCGKESQSCAHHM